MGKVLRSSGAIVYQVHGKPTIIKKEGNKMSKTKHFQWYQGWWVMYVKGT